jgi:hypothetical protein
MSSTHCASYMSENSIGYNGYADMLHGYRNNLLASNSSRLNRAKEGDIVLITAEDTSRRVKSLYTRYIMFVRLTERVDHLKDSWATVGGKTWSYCWRFDTLIHPMEYTPEIRAMVDSLSTHPKINQSTIIHSRFCPKKSMPVFLALIASLTTPVPSPKSTTLPVHIGDFL